MITFLQVKNHDSYKMSTEPIRKYLSSKGYETEIIDVINQIPNPNCKIIISNYSWATNKLKLNFDIKVPTILIFHGISIWKPLENHFKNYEYAFLASNFEKGKVFRFKDNFPKEENTIITGWPKLDILYEKLKNKEEIKKNIYKKYKLDTGKPIVAFLPTFKHSDARICGTAEMLSSPHFSKIENLIVSLHYFDTTKENIIEYMKKYPFIWKDHDKYDLLIAADIIIGDLSSVLVEALPLDKPIIHLLNKEDQLYAYQNKENGICKFGDICLDPKDLQSLIDINLEKDLNKDQRNKWKDILILNFGQAAVEAGEQIISILKSKES